MLQFLRDQASQELGLAVFLREAFEIDGAEIQPIDRLAERRKVDLRITKLSSYAEKTEPTVNPRLGEARGIDLQFMARAYGSSLHIPVKKEGLAGTINFWSTESDAFPPELVSLLSEVAQAMATP